MMNELAERVAEIGRKQIEKKQSAKATMAAKQLDAAARKEALRQSLREQMPEVTELVDAFRAVFGDGVKVLIAEENGQRISVSDAKLKSLGLSHEQSK